MGMGIHCPMVCRPRIPPMIHGVPAGALLQSLTGSGSRLETWLSESSRGAANMTVVLRKRLRRAAFILVCMRQVEGTGFCATVEIEVWGVRRSKT